MFELIAGINISSGLVHYEPYSMEDVSVFVGVPQLALKGVERIRAYRLQPKGKLVNCLTGGGAFVSNRNLNGFIELTVATESPAHAVLQIQDISGAGFPLRATDSKTGGSSFCASTSCRVVLTPEWAKSRSSQFTVYTIAAKRLLISGGIRKQVEV